MVKINRSKFIITTLIIFCSLYVFSTEAIAEDISATISGPSAGLVNEKLSFSVDVKEEWSIDEAKWNFGDGNSSSGVSVSHKYTGVGGFSVSVKVDAHREQTDADGVTTETSGSDSDSKKVTVKGKIQGGVSPDSLPADGESVCDLVIYAVDCKGFAIPSYNKSVKLSSSDSEILSPPKSLRLRGGVAETECTIGMKQGKAKIKVRGPYLESHSFKIIAKSNSAKVSSVKAVDSKDKSRFSETKLQMVGKSYASRQAKVYAYKDSKESKWDEYEPVWSGLKSDKGIDKISVSVRKTGTQTASAGGVSKSVTIEIIGDEERSVTVGTSAFGKLQDILNSAASKLGGGSDNIKADIHGGCKWHKVDQTKSPLCQNTYEFSAGGGLSFDKKIYPPCLSLNLLFVKVGGFIEPNISLNVTGLNIVKDGRYNPARFNKVEGGATLSGSLSAGIGVKIEDPLKVVLLEADLKGTVGASGSFNVSAPGPMLEGDYKIGTLKVSGMVKLLYIDAEEPFIKKKITKDFGDRDGLVHGNKTIDLSGYFNKN